MLVFCRSGMALVAKMIGHDNVVAKSFSKRRLLGNWIWALSISAIYDHSFCRIFRMITFGQEHQLRGLLT